MGFDQHIVVVETNRLLISPGRQERANMGMRDGIEGFGDHGQLVTGHFRRAPQRNVEGRRRCRQEHGLLLGFEVLSRWALRATMAAEAILLPAPMTGMHARIVQRGQYLAGKAVITNTGNRSFDSGFIPRMPHTGRVHMKLPRLRVLKKCRRDVRGECIQLHDNSLGVVGNQHTENATEELPSSFAGLNSACGSFFESGIDKAIAGEDGAKDPGTKTPTFLGDQRKCEPPHPARIHLHFLAGFAFEDRDGCSHSSKLQLLDGKAVKRGVADRHALPRQEFANLGEPQSLHQPMLNGLPLLATASPVLAVRTPAARLQRQQYVADPLVAERLHLTSQPGRFCRSQIATNRLRIQAEQRGNPFLRHLLLPEPKDFPKFDHRDLAIHPRLLLGHGPRQQTFTARSDEGGKVLKNLTSKGGKVSKKSSGRGPYVSQTDSWTRLLGGARGGKWTERLPVRFEWLAAA